MISSVLHQKRSATVAVVGILASGLLTGSQALAAPALARVDGAAAVGRVSADATVHIALTLSQSYIATGWCWT
jgi:hypothetical protein